MEQLPLDHSEAIARLGGASKIATALGALPVTVRAWAARGRIPADYWPDFIAFAQQSGVGIDADWMMTTLSRGAVHTASDTVTADAASPDIASETIDAGAAA